MKRKHSITSNVEPGEKHHDTILNAARIIIGYKDDTFNVVRFGIST